MVLRKKVTERRFALILVKHRLWGTILLPYIIEKEEGNSFYSTSECLSPYASPETIESLSDEEIELIQIINTYSDRYLYKLFSREKTVVEFLDKVNNERFEKHIKPYIEGRIARCLRMISEYKLKVYRKKTGTNNLHEDDLLQFLDEEAEPFFRFTYTPEQSSYQLDIMLNGKKLDLIGSKFEVLSNSPCLLWDNDRIFLVKDIEATRLKPFLQRDSIHIPSEHSDKYFSTYVKNIVHRNKVIAEGFIIRDVEASKKAVLDLEYNIRNIPVLILKFDYGVKEIRHDYSDEGFTTFAKEDSYVYSKYRRDRSWEVSCIRALNELGFWSDDNINFTVATRTADIEEELYTLLEAVNENFSALRDMGFEIRRQRLDKSYNLRTVSIAINYEVENDWFDLKAVVKIGDIELPFVKLRKNIIEGNRELKLEDGSVAILPEEWFVRYREVFELGKYDSGSLKLHKQHFGLLNEIFNPEECSTCPSLERLVLPEKFPVVDVPAGINADLRSYQVEGLEWLVFLRENELGACLADDMGLGKTLQTLTLLQHHSNLSAGEDSSEQAFDEGTLFAGQEKKKTSLLIVPASLIYNWLSEAKRFAPGLKIYPYKGNQRKKSVSYFPEFDIILSSYHTVRQDISILESFAFSYIILDESQVIKNPAAQLYKSISRLKSDNRLVLTGTPIENSLTDLWAQLNFANPGLLGGLSYFKREFAVPIEKHGSEERKQRLQKLINPFILRRTKEEVASELPPVFENTVYCEMSENQEKVYEEEKSAIRNALISESNGARDSKTSLVVLQGLMKLRQISNHPTLSFPEYEEDSGKFDTVLQDIMNVVAEGHKILIFSSFVRHLELFARELADSGCEYSLLTGASTNRKKIVEEFQGRAEKKVFLISLKAGGVGLNLTAADYVFILDPWWNPASEMQALNRAHRIGQDKTVFVNRYISRDSIEEKIVKLQERKAVLADTFINSNNPLKDMNINDILELIA